MINPDFEHQLSRPCLYILNVVVHIVELVERQQNSVNFVVLVLQSMENTGSVYSSVFTMLGTESERNAEKPKIILIPFRPKLRKSENPLKMIITINF